MNNEFFNLAAPKVLEIAERMKQRRHMLALAESCTGGLVAATIAAQPGVSSFLCGSVVSYARHVKQTVLGVDAAVLQAHGEVHVETARAMARGARTHLKADWGVSITGVAGPTGGSVDKPVGFVCFGVVGPSFEEVQERRFGSLARQDIQQQSVLFAFDLLLDAIR
jgi:PncC family amidohydrolase